MENTKAKVKVESGKITSSIIWGNIFYGILFYIVVAIINGLLSSIISNTWVLLALSVVLTAGYTILTWRCAVNSTIKKKTTDKQHVPKIMKGLTIFLIILIVLNIAVNFYELYNNIATARSKVESYTSLYSGLYNTNELTKIVEEQINAQLPMLYVTLGAKILIDIIVNICMLRWTKYTLEANLDEGTGESEYKEDTTSSRSGKKTIIIVLIVIAVLLIIIGIPAFLLISNLGTSLIDKTNDNIIENRTIDDVTEGLSNISSLLKNQIISSYGGKEIMGKDVIVACQQYGASNSISIKIITDNNQFQTGKYAVKLMEDATNGNNGIDIPKYKNVTYTGTNSYVELTEQTRSSYADIVAGISSNEYYYSYIMKDSSIDQIIGILFVKKDKEQQSENKVEDKISRITLYKRNFELNDYYAESINLTQEQINKVEAYLKTKKEVDGPRGLGLDSYKLEIEYANGKSVEVTTHGNTITFGNKVVDCEGLESYIFSIEGTLYSNEIKQPTINKEIFNLIGKTIEVAKKKYGSDGKVVNQAEGAVLIRLNNGITVGVPMVYEDYTDKEGVTHFKVKDSQKIIVVNATFKDMFNNYTKDCTTEEQLKKLFKEVNYHSQSFWGEMYELTYDKYSVNVIINNKKITDSTSIQILLAE